MAAPKGPSQYAKETQVLWDREPRDSTALPWLTYLPHSQLQKPHLPILVSLLPISLAIMRAQWGLQKAADYFFISDLSLCMKSMPHLAAVV